MERKIIQTRDGSSSVSVPELNVAYHSIYGAITESKHVFIEAGLKVAFDSHRSLPVRVFEVGLGTGLNSLLSLIESEALDHEVYYEAVELFPLTQHEVMQLNYCEHVGRPDLQTVFEKLHRCEWEKQEAITGSFSFKKCYIDVLSIQGHASAAPGFDVVYFDAFDPGVQPELWTKEVFDQMFSLLRGGGILVTYSSRGSARRAMKAAGFEVEKISGPPGKREMVRARKGPKTPPETVNL